ncbi:MAG TPA: hypothetical protein EYQ25_01245 [Planctomycetes bacterium]|nr:hypothetical protein [Planctomycetota bacterium]HIL36405.1 hypothetical protein [Planctomycetota bacterium]
MNNHKPGPVVRNQRAKTLTRTVFLALACTACGGGAGGPGGSSLGAGAGSGDFLVQDAPIPGLLAFQGTVTELHLELIGGGSTVNLLPTPVDVEFLGLQGTLGWLSSLESVPQGTFSGLRLVFQPGAYIARANNGSDVAVVATADELLVTFPAPQTVDGSAYHRFEIDLNLEDSLSGEIASPPLNFDPVGTALAGNGQLATDIDEIKGVITGFDPANLAFVMDAFVDDDYLLPLGPVTVTVNSATLVFQENGLPFSSIASLFAAMTVGQTAVEVHGQLGANRVVAATKVEVEDQDAGATGGSKVKIEGLIAALVPGVSFDLTIREIEGAEATATPILAGSTTITVTFDASTRFFSEDVLLNDSSLLALGQEVKVEFADFISAPFPADKVEIENVYPQFEGTITDVSGLPNSLTVNLILLDPAVLSGQVTSDSISVIVDLSVSGLALDTDNEPDLAGVTLLPGLEIEMEGSISGDPGSPTISSVKTEVEPGKLKDALVATIDELASSFTVTGAVIKDPFGGNLAGGSLAVLLDPVCVYDGDVLSEAQLFAAFNALAPGEVLEVEIKGLATANVGELVAYELKAKVMTP